MRLNIHQVSGQSDWAPVPAGQRNAWQKVAAATRGFVTIGNFFSLLSLASAPVGLVYILNGGHYLSGSAIILSGRLCDLLDGYLADKTATKSKIGEAIDATSDKVITIVVLAALALYGVVPVWFVVLLGAPQFIIALIAATAFVRHRPLHPQLMGKLSMGFGWVGLLVYVVAQAVGDKWQGTLQVCGIVLLALSLVMGAVAVGAHVRTLHSREP